MENIIEILMAARMFIYSITFDKAIEYGYDTTFAEKEALKQVKEIDEIIFK